MSLINDALKRAKEAQPATAPTPEPEQPMQPVGPLSEPAPSRSLPPYFLPAVLIVLCGACWFLIKGWETKRQAGLYPEPVTVLARETGTDASASAAKASQEKPGSPSNHAASDATAKLPTPTNPATSNSSAPPQAASTVAIPEAPARPQPTFKLQGIFYRPSNPSAVVNAKTVFIGDIVNEAKVTSIDRQSVTLVHEGQTKVLTLQ